jgi:hypothetical protein
LAELLQIPAAWQSVVLVQALPEALHLPPTITQSEMLVQEFCRTLHLPMSTQSDCCMQLLAVMLQTPGWLVQSEACVQVLVVWMLHLRGSGVHTGGGQVWTGVQVFSGLGASSSQPGGS